MKQINRIIISLLLAMTSVASAWAAVPMVRIYCSTVGGSVDIRNPFINDAPVATDGSGLVVCNSEVRIQVIPDNDHTLNGFTADNIQVVLSSNADAAEARPITRGGDGPGVGGTSIVVTKATDADDVWVFNVPEYTKVEGYNISVTVTIPDKPYQKGVKYIDATGTEQTTPTDVKVYTLDGTETTLGRSGNDTNNQPYTTWYACPNGVTYDHTITTYGNVNIIVPSGKTFAVGSASTAVNGSGIYAEGSLCLYGQSTATGKIFINSSGLCFSMIKYSLTITHSDVDLNSSTKQGVLSNDFTILGCEDYNNLKIHSSENGIYSNKSDIIIKNCNVDIVSSNGGGISSLDRLYIIGGQVDVSGAQSKHGLIPNNGATISWVKPTDYVKASTFEVSLSIAEGQRYVAYTVSGTTESAYGIFSGTGFNCRLLDGKILRPLVGNVVKITSGKHVGVVGKSAPDFTLDGYDYYTVAKDATVTLNYTGDKFVHLDPGTNGPALSAVNGQPLQRSFTMPNQDVTIEVVEQAIDVNDTSVTYNGNAQLPIFAFGNETLEDSNHFTCTVNGLSNVDNPAVNAGQYDVKITGIGNYIGQSEGIPFTINPKPVTPTVSVSGNYTYTGTAHTPTYTVTVDNTTIDDESYTLTWQRKKASGYYDDVSSVLHSGVYRAKVSDKNGGNYKISADTYSNEFTVSPATVNNVHYVDVRNGRKTAATANDVTVLEGHETTLKTGTYVAMKKYNNIGLDLMNYESITIDGDVKIILESENIMAVNNPNGWAIKGTNTDDGEYTDKLSIHDQGGHIGQLQLSGYNGGIYVGTLNIVGGKISGNDGEYGFINTDGDFTMLNGNLNGSIVSSGNASLLGGIVNAPENSKGIRCGRNKTITLGWLDANSDYIRANSFTGTVQTATDKRFMAYTVSGTTETPSGLVSGTVSDNSTINGKMLRPYVGNVVAIPTNAPLSVINEGVSATTVGDNRCYTIVAGETVKLSYTGTGLYKLTGLPTGTTFSAVDNQPMQRTFTMPAEDITLAVSAVDIGIEDVALTYDGQPKAPRFKFDGVQKTAGTDYTIAFAQGSTPVTEAVNAGEYEAYLTGLGQYVGTSSAQVFTVSNPVMNGVSYVDIVNGVKTTRTADNVTVLCGTESTLKSGFYVALPSYDGKALDLTKYDRIAIDGNVSIILADGATMHVENPGGWCIIGSNDDGNANWTDGLKIYGQSAQTGTISTVGYKGGIYVGTLAIYGGNITDNGTSTPCFDADGDVSILNGNVTGTIHSGGRLTVSGGNVTSVVPDGQSGYAITCAGDLSVSGGVVTAIADRGQALRSNNGNVSISGGQVTADGSSVGIRVGYGRTVTLGWTAESDYIFASSYAGTVRTASGQRFLARNGGGNNSPVTGIVSGSYNNMNAFNSMMLRPLIGNFVSTGDGLNIADREKSFSLDNKDYYITALDADVKVGYSGSGLVKTGVQPASITLSDEHGFKMPAEDVILTATAVSGLAVSESFIYNGSGQVPGSLTYGTGGSMTADDFSIEGISQGGTAASEAINAGDYTAALKGKGVYIGSESVDFSIGVRTVTVADGITAGSKDYDGTTDVTIDCTGAAFGNIVEGDDLSVSGITGAFADATAGKDKEIALDYSAAVLGGEDAGNYVLAADGNQAVATATINTIDIVGITAIGYEGIYDGAAHTINVDGVPEDAAITFGTSADGCTLTETPALTDVGEMTVYYKVSKANYNDVTGSATVKVGVRTVTVASGITAGSKDYDGTTDVTIDCSGAAFSNLVEGETITISGVTGAFADADAGEDKVVTLDYSEAVLGGEDAGNYVLATDADANQAVATASISTIDIVGITATGYEAIYDSEAHSITVNDVPEGAIVTYGASAGDCTLTENPAFTNVGENTVFYLVTKANYNDVTGSATVIITPKDVTVTTGSATKAYDGEALTCAEATITGLVEGESVVVTTIGSQTGVGTSDNTYTIDWGNYLSDNYTITDELGTLEVTFATIAYNGASIKKDENGYYINMAENSGNAKPLPIDGTVVDLRYGRVLLAPGEDGEGDLTIDGQAANLYTVCLPFKPKAARNAKYYTLRRVEGSTLKFEEVTSPEAFMPYLVSVTGSNDVFETCKDVTFEVDEHIYSTTVSGFTFTGTLKGLTNREARTAAGGSNKVTYFLQRKAKWGKVVKGDVYLPPFRAYIIGPEVDTGNARALDSSFDGEATEIWNIQTVDADGTERWYDLNGRRIEKPTQTGIYIHNGRKEVIR